MSKGMILGLVWAILVGFTAWWVYKNLKPGFLK